MQNGPVAKYRTISLDITPKKKDGGDTVLAENEREPLLARKEKEDMGIMGAIFNLTNTTLGGGISLISLPLSTKLMGIWAMPTAEVVSCSLTIYSLMLLHYISGMLTSDGESISYQALARRLVGQRVGLIVPLFIVLNNLGVCVGFLSVFGDTIPDLLGWNRKLCIGGLTILLLFPVMVIKHISALRFSSMLSIVFVIVLLGLVIYQGIAAIIPGGDNYPLSDHTIVGLGGHMPNLPDCITGMSIISLSYTCHFNLLPIKYGLHSSNHDRVGTVVIASQFLTCVIYLAFGLFAYLAYLDNTTPDILQTLASPLWPIQMIRVLIVIGVVITIPLFVLEAAGSAKSIAGAGCRKGKSRKGKKKKPKTKQKMPREEETLNTPTLRSTSSKSGPRVPHLGLSPSPYSVSGQSEDSQLTVQVERQNVSPSMLFARSNFGPKEVKLKAEEEEDGEGQCCIPCGAELGCRIVFTVLAGVFTICIDNTSGVLALVGSACGVPIMYIFPPILYLRCLQINGKRTCCNSVVPVIVVLVGVVLCIAGVSVVF